MSQITVTMSIEHYESMRDRANRADELERFLRDKGRLPLRPSDARNEATAHAVKPAAWHSPAESQVLDGNRYGGIGHAEVLGAKESWGSYLNRD